jgi:hypothetical protein
MSKGKQLAYKYSSQMLRRSSMHLGRNIAGSVGSYLPDVLTEIWEPTRDFASLKLPSAGVRSLVALSRLVNIVIDENLLFNSYFIVLHLKLW